MLKKIISGGQTGADRAALDFAIKHKIPHGGWVPKGRIAEDGPLPAKYKLREMPTTSYQKRTEQNVIDSDGTVILTYGSLTAGSDYTHKMAVQHQKPWLHLDLDVMPSYEAALSVVDWLKERHIEVLNVAGSRASKDPEIYGDVTEILETAFEVLSAKKILDVNTQIKKNTSRANSMGKRPGTVLEAVDQLMKELDLAQKTQIAKMAEDVLIRLQVTIGLFIRNQFFYPRNERLLESCRDHARDKNLNVDQAPSVIIRELRKKLQKTHKLKVVK